MSTSCSLGRGPPWQTWRPEPGRMFCPGTAGGDRVQQRILVQFSCLLPINRLFTCVQLCLPVTCASLLQWTSSPPRSHDPWTWCHSRDRWRAASCLTQKTRTSDPNGTRENTFCEKTAWRWMLLNAAETCWTLLKPAETWWTLPPSTETWLRINLYLISSR